MQSNSHGDKNNQNDEHLFTQEYIHQISDSLHQQIWEVRRVAYETRYIVRIVFWLVVLILFIVSREFISAISAWLVSFDLLIKKLIFWSILFFIVGFLGFFLFRAARVLCKTMWTGSNLQIRLQKIINKKSISKKQTRFNESGNKPVDAEQTGYSQRMNEYLQEAQDFLDKRKEAQYKD